MPPRRTASFIVGELVDRLAETVGDLALAGDHHVFPGEPQAGDEEEPAEDLRPGTAAVVDGRDSVLGVCQMLRLLHRHQQHRQRSAEEHRECQQDGQRLSRAQSAEPALQVR